MARAFSSTVSGSSFGETDKRNVWNKARVVNGYDSSQVRKDSCGAWIKYSEYGNTSSEYGWEIDHIIPVSVGGSDQLSNLQPLQWQNNRSKSDKVDGDYCKVVAKV